MYALPPPLPLPPSILLCTHNVYIRLVNMHDFLQASWVPLYIWCIVSVKKPNNNCILALTLKAGHNLQLAYKLLIAALYIVYLKHVKMWV